MPSVLFQGATGHRNSGQKRDTHKMSHDVTLRERLTHSTKGDYGRCLAASRI